MYKYKYMYMYMIVYVYVYVYVYIISHHLINIIYADTSSFLVAKRSGCVSF